MYGAFQLQHHALSSQSPSDQATNGGVSYEEMNFALLIPMPEVNKKHTRMTKHRDLK